MSVATRPEETALVSATAKYVRISARKARLVADLVRGKPVPEALGILRFSTRAAAGPLTKALRSAMANAEHNGGLDADSLRLARVTIDEGPTIRRFRPRAMGRATRIRKRTCHITIGLAPTPVSGSRKGRR